VLQVDAGQVFVSFDFHKINELIGQGKVEQFLYTLQYGSGSQLIGRFFNRKKGNWKGIVHEYPILTDAKQDKICTLSSSILSLIHLKNVDKPRGFYASGLALSLLEHPTSIRDKYYFAREMYYMKNYTIALSILNDIKNKNITRMESSNFSCLAGHCEDENGNETKAIQHYQKACEIEANWRSPWIFLAEIHAKNKNHIKVVCYCNASLAISKKTSPLYEEMSLYTWKPHWLLTQALMQLERVSEAKLHYKTYKSCCPSALQENIEQLDAP